MQRRSVSRLKPGMKLACSVMSNDGAMWLAKDTILTEQYVEALQGLVSAVYVLPEGFEDVARWVVLPDETARFHLVKRLEGVYCYLYDRLYIDSPKPSNLAPPRPKRECPFLQEARDMRHVEDVLFACAKEIARDALSGEGKLLSFDISSPKHNLLYVFEHVVASAIIAARIFAPSVKEGSFSYIDAQQGYRFQKTHPADEKRLEDLVAGIMLMEIGMMAIPREVLKKPRFSEEEKTKYLFPHPKIGRDAVRPLQRLSPISTNIVLHHHERRDGGGYPFGVSDFHPLIDVASIASTFDALVSSRPQHLELGAAGDDKSFAPAEAMEHLYALARDGVVNGGILEELVKHVVPYPMGTTVILSNGDVGVVVDCSARQNPLRQQRPLVRCTMSASDAAKKGMWEIDLASRLDLQVTRVMFA